MSEQLERRYQPERREDERRGFYMFLWLRERRKGFDRRAKVEGRKP